MELRSASSDAFSASAVSNAFATNIIIKKYVSNSRESVSRRRNQLRAMSSYVPDSVLDLCLELAGSGVAVNSDRVATRSGAVVIADISGFTALSESLTRPRDAP